jgi:carboxylate-amine ligase
MDAAQDEPGPGRVAAPVRYRALTVGVEEEFVLADAGTRRAVRTAEPVVAAAASAVGAGQVTGELSRGQVETIGGVCVDAPQLAAEVTRLRRAAARAARKHGLLLVAAGTAPLGDPGPPPVLDKPRYRRIAEQFGPVAHGQCVNGCHVHVGVPNREEAVQVVNHLRPWLPLLIALTVNSPYRNGTDTGYAGWRTVQWGRWPAAGPPPYLRSAEHYERLVDALVDTGAALDPGMVYWLIRPSRHVPTVEVRSADVLPSVAETVGYVVLVRALTAWSLTQVRQGRPAPPVEDAVLRGACWRAARDGLAGEVPATALAGRPRPLPARHLLAYLLQRLAPYLHAAGDAPALRQWLGLLRERGTGADRQRAAHRRAGRLEDVVDALAVTDAGPAAG